MPVRSTVSKTITPAKKANRWKITQINFIRPYKSGKGIHGSVRNSLELRVLHLHNNKVLEERAYIFKGQQLRDIMKAVTSGATLGKELRNLMYQAIKNLDIIDKGATDE